MKDALYHMVLLTVGTLASGQHGSTEEAIEEAQDAYEILVSAYDSDETDELDELEDETPEVSAIVLGHLRNFLNATTLAEGEQFQRLVRNNQDYINTECDEIQEFARRLLTAYSVEQGRALQRDVRTFVNSLDN